MFSFGWEGRSGKAKMYNIFFFLFFWKKNEWENLLMILFFSYGKDLNGNVKRGGFIYNSWLVKSCESKFTSWKNLEIYGKLQ
jgi:hypothetical protein